MDATFLECSEWFGRIFYVSILVIASGVLCLMVRDIYLTIKCRDND
jgi:hypothetical protein